MAPVQPHTSPGSAQEPATTPTTSATTAPPPPPKAFRVLVTGFGPFSHYEENPSWLAVKPLQNVVLQTDEIPAQLIPPHPTAASAATATATSSSSSVSSNSISTSRSTSAPEIDDALLESTKPRPIHITTLKIPVTYDAVLSTVPALHARPPVLPADAPADASPPPKSNFDFIFHIGVAGRGPLRMERQGHKLGYQMKDATGKLAPVVRHSAKSFIRREEEAGGAASGSAGGGAGGVGVGVGGGGAGAGLGLGGGGGGVSAAENAERERLGMDPVEGGNSDPIARPTRGFGVGYENFPDEITTDIDVTRLVHDLKRSGVEQIYTSMDAGHYLCDFIYYCSLAEARRTTKPYDKRRHTQVLFLHCPPVNQPLATEEVTDAIKRIVVWVCNEQQVMDVKEDVAALVGGGSAGAGAGGGAAGAGAAAGVSANASAQVQVSA